MCRLPHGSRTAVGSVAPQSPADRRFSGSPSWSPAQHQLTARTAHHCDQGKRSELAGYIAFCGPTGHRMVHLPAIRPGLARSDTWAESSTSGIQSTGVNHHHVGGRRALERLSHEGCDRSAPGRRTPGPRPLDGCHGPQPARPPTRGSHPAARGAGRAAGPARPQGGTLTPGRRRALTPVTATSYRGHVANRGFSFRRGWPLDDGQRAAGVSPIFDAEIGGSHTARSRPAGISGASSNGELGLAVDGATSGYRVAGVRRRRMGGRSWSLAVGGRRTRSAFPVAQ